MESKNDKSKDRTENKFSKGDKDMAITRSEVKIDVERSILNSLDEVERIREGTLPKKSYKEMIAKIRKKLNEESK